MTWTNEQDRLMRAGRAAEGSPEWGAACYRLAERGKMHNVAADIAREMELAEERARREARPAWHDDSLPLAPKEPKS